MDWSMPGFPVLHCLPEFAQTQIHRVGDAIQPSHPHRPLLLPSIFPSIRIFPVKWLFASGGQSIGASASVSVLPMNIQDWFPLGLTVLISLQFKGLSRVFFNTTAQKHQFFGTQAYVFQGLKLCSISYQLYGLGSLPNSSVPQFSHPESGEKDKYTTSHKAAVRICEFVSTKGSEQHLASCRYWVLAIISSPEYPTMLPNPEDA